MDLEVPRSSRGGCTTRPRPSAATFDRPGGAAGTLEAAAAIAISSFKRKGFAFVKFFDPDSAQRAVHELDGGLFHDQLGGAALHQCV